MPGDSGVLVVTRVRSITIIAHEAAGALGIRRSPRPPWAENKCTARAHPAARRVAACGLDVVAETQTPSFRDGPKDQTSDAQLRIGESRDSGFDASHRPGMTAVGLFAEPTSAAPRIASRSLSSGAHSRDPLARNDGWFRMLATATR